MGKLLIECERKEGNRVFDGYVKSCMKQQMEQVIKQSDN